MRFFGHLLLCAALVGCAPVGRGQALSVERGARASALGARVELAVQGKATGYVLITQGDTTLLARGFGSADGRIPPPRRETAFDVASISKLFTAVVILRLVDQGKVDLESPVRRYLPELPPKLQDITLRHALQHDAGFPQYLSGDDQTPKTAAQVLAEIGSLERDRSAGMGFRYSDVGYTTLALVVERVTGTSFSDAMRELVFQPARLSGTGFYGDPWRSRPVATEFTGGKPTGSPATFGYTYNLAGTGQIATTVDDLHRLFGRLNSGRFLSPRARSLLFGPGIATAGRLPYRGVTDVTYSMGLFHFRDRQGRMAHGHGGANDFGGHGFVSWRPEDELFVVGLFNSGGDTFNRSAFIAAATELTDGVRAD